MRSIFVVLLLIILLLIIAFLYFKPYHTIRGGAKNEILEYLLEDKPLTSTPVLKEFHEEYPQQNGGILNRDVMKLVKCFDPSCKLVHVDTRNVLYKPIAEDVAIVTDKDETHSIYKYHRQYYNNMNHPETSKWSNNCTLYAGIAACIRPSLRTYDECDKILRNITDDQWYGLSTHYFSRGKEWFHPSS